MPQSALMDLVMRSMFPCRRASGATGCCCAKARPKDNTGSNTCTARVGQVGNLRPIGNRPAEGSDNSPRRHFTWTKISRLLGLLFRGGVICHEPLGDFVGYVRACAQEFTAQTFRGSGPDHVAILTNKPNSGHGLVLAFLTVMRLAFTDAQPAIAIARSGAHIPGASGRTAADLRVCVDAIGRLKGIGEDRIRAGAFER